ncbi:hypothetical protein [Capillimicrobium parvum]|uniref:hypothetical protein n=1 Tax=Capillimicrobium parvum TaxID=2884022 RepID=UPI00216B03A5|nr:hypothetical protein [Capillimicrobium parvum]
MPLRRRPSSSGRPPGRRTPSSSTASSRGGDSGDGDDGPAEPPPAFPRRRVYGWDELAPEHALRPSPQMDFSEVVA